MSRDRSVQTEVSSWGNTSKVEATLFMPSDYDEAAQIINNGFRGIPRGSGLSYGDSALARQLLSSRNLNEIMEFDPGSGFVRCQAGVTLQQLLSKIVLHGWFICSTPGTKNITVGGAVASDVHGKSHCYEGCFSEHVEELKILTGQGEIVTCSRSINPELFLATCGGMGLTGFILEAAFNLKPIKSTTLTETVLKTKNLEETLHKLGHFSGEFYSVAWMDLLAGGDGLGRGVVRYGTFDDRGDLEVHSKPGMAIPDYFPSFLLNRFSIKLFNRFYYRQKFKNRFTQKVHYEDFFYPLDKIQNWNRVYGEKGLMQYQFVVPGNVALPAIRKIIEKIQNSEHVPTLAVLKKFGDENENYLSFPFKGYALAIDFKNETGLESLMRQMDKVVMRYDGRLYLTKDNRMPESMFKNGYPRYGQFIEAIKKYGDHESTFDSFQSSRINLFKDRDNGNG